MKNKNGHSFVVIMIIIAVVALLLRITIEQIIKISIIRNESSAQSTLKSISTALENYAKNNRNAYPDKFSSLFVASPAYLDKDYTITPSFKGYVYSCPRLEKIGYTCSAVPLSCKLTGASTFTITTGGALVKEPCDK
jgi:Tfp pilus assembly protein PilE